MRVDKIIFKDSDSEFGRLYPTSYLMVSEGETYRIEMPSKEALSAVRIVAEHQRTTGQAIDDEMLYRKALEIDPDADLENRRSHNPLANILLNMDNFWPDWQQGKGIKVFEYEHK